MSQNLIISIVFLLLLFIFVIYIIYTNKKIKTLEKEKQQIQEGYKTLEDKQHDLLENMGNSIHNITKKTLKETTRLAQKSQKSPLHTDIEKVMHNENELLGVTNDLIQFIQLKSKKVAVKNELCNFNNIINETIGLLSDICTRHKTELVFDIDNSVPPNFIIDSSHIGKILLNFITYFVQNSQSNKIIVKMKTEKDNLIINIISDLHIKDKEHFFDSNYNEKTREYMGLGLYISKELIDLMQGKVTIFETNIGDNLFITIPIAKREKEDIPYKLTDVGNRILLVDIDTDSSIALSNRLNYFNLTPTVKTEEEFINHLPHFINYDILMIHKKLLTDAIIKKIELVQKTHSLKVVAIENMYEASIQATQKIIDLVLFKPFSPEYIYNSLTNLYHSNNISHNYTSTLPIYKEEFVDILDIELKDFNKFSGKHLLLVEDNLINQKLIKSLLSKSNMTISTVNNGEETLHFLEKSPHRVDFILMDINMPVMDGFTATEHIRKKEKYNNIPIISLTALVADYEIVKMFNVGMNGYLSKPIGIGKLYAAFNTFLDNGVENNSVDNQDIVFNGLDTNKGLLSMHNNKNFYKEVLREFISAYDKSDIVLDLLIDKKRYEEAKKLCLDIKGLANTIGATDSAEICNSIYNKLVFNKYDNLKEHTKAYASSLIVLKSSIEKYLDI